MIAVCALSRSKRELVGPFDTEGALIATLWVARTTPALSQYRREEPSVFAQAAPAD